MEVFANLPYRLGIPATKKELELERLLRLFFIRGSDWLVTTSNQGVLYNYWQRCTVYPTEKDRPRLGALSLGSRGRDDSAEIRPASAPSP